MRILYTNINGKLVEAAQATLPPDNRAFRYGYGLFETMLVQEGVINLAAYHWERLFRGMQQLAIEPPKLFTKEFLGQEVIRTVKKNQLEKLCRVRLQVYAGEGGLYDIQDSKPGFIIECFPLNASLLDLNEHGLVLGIATELSKSVDNLANLKTSNALIYAMAAQQAKVGKWNDALISNTAGNIIESTIANIFWVNDKQVFTPPLSEGCIAGVMRRQLLEVLPSKGYSVSEQVLTAEILATADSIFLTNVIRHIKWVGQIGDTSYNSSLIPAIYRDVFL
ncbi:MAG: 4-amino-4-deoxychorismate lyase [Sphingobacteriales bacterium]|nr:MAG: 4-amino-4-deoxychorismate lyase [Sphingobacteriales bacterium]